jgi:hypothetical protein
MTYDRYNSYQKAYNAKRENKDKRNADNKARRNLGLKKGDPRHAGRKERGSNSMSNFKVQDAHANRSHGGRVGSKAGKAKGGRNSRKG